MYVTMMNQKYSLKYIKHFSTLPTTSTLNNQSSMVKIRPLTSWKCLVISLHTLHLDLSARSEGVRRRRVVSREINILLGAGITTTIFHIIFYTHVQG